MFRAGTFTQGGGGGTAAQGETLADLTLRKRGGNGNRNARKWVPRAGQSSSGPHQGYTPRNRMVWKVVFHFLEGPLKGSPEKGGGSLFAWGGGKGGGVRFTRQQKKRSRSSVSKDPIRNTQPAEKRSGQRVAIRKFPMSRDSCAQGCGELKGGYGGRKKKKGTRRGRTTK